MFDKSVIFLSNYLTHCTFSQLITKRYGTYYLLEKYIVERNWFRVNIMDLDPRFIIRKNDFDISDRGFESEVLGNGSESEIPDMSHWITDPDLIMSRIINLDNNATIRISGSG
ncbi:hypothetical protein Trydic_g16318 [Trypoxylus dichotomus]